MRSELMKKIAILCLLGAVPLLGFAQTTDCTNAKEARRPAVMAFRVLNTAEMQFQRANHRYASLAELMKSAELKNTSEMIASAGNDPVKLGAADDPLPGYALRLIVALDGKSYALTATKKDVPCRSLGATTDDRGVIYLIEPMR